MKRETISKKKIAVIILLFLSLIAIFIGISYAIFNYFGEGMTNNAIQTGRVIFSYSDANGGNNGILIEDALPISDEQGKLLADEGEYFDFTVSASTTKTDLIYEITVNKDQASTLPDDWIKVYLTTFDGSSEESTPLTEASTGIVTYDELQNTTNQLLSGKTVYYGDVKAGEVAYGKRFRLRMWVKDPNQTNFDYTTLNNKSFSLKVNVAAVGTY